MSKKIHLEVTLEESQEVFQFDLPLRYTVDQVKTKVFNTVLEDPEGRAQATLGLKEVTQIPSRHFFVSPPDEKKNPPSPLHLLSPFLSSPHNLIQLFMPQYRSPHSFLPYTLYFLTISDLGRP
eukprot:TRINITY_DN1355_c0_g1_i1.p2 TRINITY_DN1355_c0_g1~~TRINITY_DN1355_c0_g1_i1.p2  ORF type:complete len:123 (+),score=1.45 TRINITY_DN1355_c0_g1_i1:119-487(+)